MPFARTRHQSRCAGSEPTVSCETVVTCVKVSGAENDSELSISIVYEAAPATSLQLNAMLAPRENLASLAGLDSVGAVNVDGDACTTKRRVAENGPKLPSALRARTRHHSACAGRLPTLACDAATIWLARNGADIVDESSTCNSSTRHHPIVAGVETLRRRRRDGYTAILPVPKSLDAA